MDINRLCSTLEERVANELRGADDAAARDEILIEALYELSRSILPQLGYPKKSDEYLEKQAVVLDVITFISIELIRSASGRRGVAVLSEVGEGCLDPLLKKKLLVYAQELLAKLTKDEQQSSSSVHRRAGWAIAVSGAALVAAVYLAAGLGGPAVQPDAPRVAATPEATHAPAVSYHASISAPVAPVAAGGATTKEQVEETPRQADPPVQEARGATAQGEQSTKIRIVNSQLLVPVTLRNGGESVRVELVLDTGATRTAIHDNLTTKLKIDLRTTKMSQAEVADGRIISSRRSRIDAVVVGPFAMSAADVELIPYRGGDGLHDGLLGMDFLGKHRYQVDMEREVIRWFQ